MTSSAQTRLGYDSALVFSYQGLRGEAKSYDFTSYADMGPVIPALVDALTRLSSDKRGTTANGSCGILRLFCKFLRESQWHEKHVYEITGDTLVAFSKWRSPGESTAYGRFQKMRAIVDEALNYGGHAHTINVPYERRPRPGQQKPTDALSDVDLKAVLNAARSEATRIWQEFDAAHGKTAPAIVAELLEFAKVNGGLLPVGDTDPAFNHFEHKHVYSSGKMERMRWHRWLYATNEALLPFVILITYGLAGNVHSVLEMERESMQTSEDPLRGNRAVVRLTKHRAGRELGPSFRDMGQFSVPTLIRQVLAMTEPLLPHVPPPQRTRLFIAYFPWGRQKASVRIATPSGFGQVLRGFCKRNDLRRSDGTPLTFSLNILRTTKINRAYLKSGDIFLASKIAQHKHLSTTIHYLNQMTTVVRDQAMIADIQRELANGAVQPAQAPALAVSATGAAQGSERDCADPYAAHHEMAGGLCKDWTYPLNDPSLVIPHEPKYVAALLRDRAALRDARLRINAERFQKLYEPKLRIIEDEILPRFDNTVIAEAEALVSDMPLARSIN